LRQVCGIWITASCIIDFKRTIVWEHNWRSLSILERKFLWLKLTFPWDIFEKKNRLQSILTEHSFSISRKKIIFQKNFMAKSSYWIQIFWKKQTKTEYLVLERKELVNLIELGSDFCYFLWKRFFLGWNFLYENSNFSWEKYFEVRFFLYLDICQMYIYSLSYFQDITKFQINIFLDTLCTNKWRKTLLLGDL